MVCKSRVRRHYRPARLVALIVFGLGLGVALGAQVTTELSNQAIAVGERVTYIITIDHEAPEDVEVASPDFPGLRVVEGPTIRPISLLIGAERERAVEVRFVLEAVTAGRYVLPAVPFRVAGQPYVTSERLMEIGERRNRSSVPFLARWSGTDRALSVGESRVYGLEIYNVPDYLYPSSISVAAPPNAIFEEVQGLGSIEQYVVDGVTLYAIPVAVFMVTASEAGTLELPEALIVAESLEAVAEPRSVEILELPEAVESSGAVGDFAFSASATPSSLIRSETVELRIRVAGTGNLHFLGIPEPELVGFQIEHDETQESLIATEVGYEGHVERVMTLRPAAQGPYRVDLPDFVYLDPETGRVERQSSRFLSPVVLESNQPVSETGDVTSVEILDPDELAALERRIWYDDPLSYGWFVPGLLAFFASRIWRRKEVAATIVVIGASLLLTNAASDRLPWSDIDRGYERYAEGNLPAAISAFERASRAVPDSAGLNHNLSVLYFQVGDVPRAVLAAREAVRLAPFSDRSRELLAAVERSAGIDRSVAPPHLVHPDFFFMLAAALVNTLFIGLAFSARRRAANEIVAILIVLLIGGAVAGLTITAFGHEHQLGVLRGDITLRRIPEADADGWLPVKSGAAVRVLSRTGNALLVQTVLGLEGWVSLEDILWNEVPVFSLIRYRGFVL